MDRRFAPLSLAARVLVPLAALLLASSPVIAAPGLTITPATGQPGSEVTAVAVGFAPGSTVTFLWNAQPDAVLGTAMANSAGEASLTFQIPVDETPGAAVVRACGAPQGCPPGTEFADAFVDVFPIPLGDDDALGASLALLIIALMALGLGYLTVSRLSRTRDTFKPLPRKKHEHEREDVGEIIEERRQDAGR